jgi:hypothetical protein
LGNLIEENKNSAIDRFRHYGTQNGLAYTYVCIHLRVRKESAMTTMKVGVREFRERIASFLESDSPVAVTRRGETLGVYVPTRRKHPRTADLGELKAAATRLAEVLADMDEEEVVADFKQLRHQSKNPSR